MTGCMPVLMLLTGCNASGTKCYEHWNLIDWKKANYLVKKLQRRIVKVVKARKWKKVRDLQRLLVHSYSAKVLSIRRVTENTGKRTPWY